MHVIHLHQISKHFGKQVLYQNGSLSILAGDRIGLVGLNGSGKTTLFRLIAGQEPPDQGEISFSEKVTVGYFSQEVAEMRERTVLEEVLSGAGRLSQLRSQMADLEKQLEQVEALGWSASQLEKAVHTYGDWQLEFQQRGGYDLEARSQAVLSGLGFSEQASQDPVERYSGGWKMRIELAKILVLRPDVLLMDEPTNHLDLESILWLEEWLLDYPGALMMTSHDRAFLNRLVTRCVAIEHQSISHYAGNYDFYEREREVRKALRQAAVDKQEALIAKEQAFIDRFGAKASYASRVQSRVKKIEKIERLEVPPEARLLDFRFPETPRSGQEVLKIGKLGHSWKGPDAPRAQWVFRDFQTVVRRGDRVAVVGVNGAGKSTLLKILAEQIEPTEGSVTLGANVHVGYFSQSALDLLNPARTLLEEMQDFFPQASPGWLRQLLGVFLFSGDAVHKKVGALSGGEKSRAVLATLLGSPKNLLILDEPTNHLDLQTRERLIEAVRAFAGTLLVVSHDRHFLAAVSQRVFEVREGRVLIHERSYGATGASAGGQKH